MRSGIGVLLAALAACSSPQRQQPQVVAAPAPAPPVAAPLQLGETPLALELQPGACRGQGVLLLVLHGNERAALATLRAQPPWQGVTLANFAQQHQRLLRFHLHGRNYRIDPNRLFSPAGIAADLTRHGADSAAARAAVAAFADALSARLALGPAQVVVALHNNHPGGYSAASYLPGARLARNAAAVRLAPGVPVDRFFLLTDARLFAPLAAQGFNVVLQDNAAAVDDGSLSVYAGRHGIPYLNIETASGEQREQQAMLSSLLALLPGLGLGRCRA